MKEAYLSEWAGRPLIEYIRKAGYHINLIRQNNYVDPRISTHADLFMCQFGLWNEAGLFFGDAEKLGQKYPEDIIYNALCTRDYFVHMLSESDPDMMNAMMLWRESIVSASEDTEQMKVIGVSQGYSRCTCLPVDNSSFITADAGLANALESQGASVLTIKPGSILLPGFDYGFIGGCAGHIYIDNLMDPDGPSQRAIVFNGDLSRHPDFEKICDFIKSRNIYPVYFEDYPLEDIGSILCMEAATV